MRLPALLVLTVAVVPACVGAEQRTSDDATAVESSVTTTSPVRPLRADSFVVRDGLVYYLTPLAGNPSAMHHDLVVGRLDTDAEDRVLASRLHATVGLHANGLFVLDKDVVLFAGNNVYRVDRVTGAQRQEMVPYGSYWGQWSDGRSIYGMSSSTLWRVDDVGVTIEDSSLHDDGSPGVGSVSFGVANGAIYSFDDDWLGLYRRLPDGTKQPYDSVGRHALPHGPRFGVRADANEVYLVGGARTTTCTHVTSTRELIRVIVTPETPGGASRRLALVDSNGAWDLHLAPKKLYFQSLCDGTVFSVDRVNGTAEIVARTGPRQAGDPKARMIEDGGFLYFMAEGKLLRFAME